MDSEYVDILTVLLAIMTSILSYFLKREIDKTKDLSVTLFGPYGDAGKGLVSKVQKIESEVQNSQKDIKDIKDGLKDMSIKQAAAHDLLLKIDTTISHMRDDEN